MRAFKVEQLSYAQLKNMSKPQNVSEPEGLPWVLYDTQATVLATPTRLEFFSTLQTNKSLGNLDLAGQLTSGEYFMIKTIGMDILLPPLVSTAGTSEVNAMSEIYEILFGDATTGADSGRFTFNMLSKSIGPFPLSFLHASGGPTGYGWGTFTAEESNTFANNGIFDGGFPFGNLVIPPNTNFNVALEWGGATTLIAERSLRVWLNGVKYRPIR
mgnify:CR=1 FL=1